MKKVMLLMALAFVLGLSNTAIAQCSITGNFQNGRNINGWKVNDHSINLIKGKKFYVEVNIKDVSGTGNYRPFRIYLQNNRDDANNPSMSDLGFPVLHGNLIGGSGGSYESRSTNNNYNENDWEKTRETTLSADYQRIRIIADIDGFPNVRGRYTIKIFSDGCNSNGSSRGSGNSGSGSNSSSSGSGNTSVSNSSGNSNSGNPRQGDTYSNLETGCSFKGNYQTAKGQFNISGFSKAYGFTTNGDYKIELIPKIDPSSQRSLKQQLFFNVELASTKQNLSSGLIVEGAFNQGDSNIILLIAGENTGTAKYGDSAFSKTIKDKRYNVLKVGFGSNAGDIAKGSYEVKIIGGGCSGSASTAGNTNNNSDSKKPGNTGNSDDGSIDLGRLILDKIKERRNNEKKPKENSSGDNNSSNSFGDGVTIFESKNQAGKSSTFGVGTYRADYGPIKAIGNDTASSIIVENGYRVKICQNEGNNNQGSGNCEEYGAGNYNLKYDNQASWIKVWKDGSSDRNNDSTPPPVTNNPPTTSQGSRTVKLFFYKSKKGDTRCATNLVSVNRQISSSQSVLRESLNALFGDDDSGMDDYTTGLSLVNLTITNGVANIVVSGSQNSACASLFEEQVRKTAMQFPTVRDVNIQFQ
jgi:hypothetical protein